MKLARASNAQILVTACLAADPTALPAPSCMGSSHLSSASHEGKVLAGQWWYGIFVAVSIFKKPVSPLVCESCVKLVMVRCLVKMPDLPPLSLWHSVLQPEHICSECIRRCFVLPHLSPKPDGNPIMYTPVSIAILLKTD